LKRDSSNENHPFDQLGEYLATARAQSRLTQDELAERCGMTQSEISKLEAGERRPLPHQLARLARELGVALQWFLTGHNQPGFDLGDMALEFRHLGIVDLFIPDPSVPGAFRLPEQIVACAVSGDLPDPRIVEALPAVFAWNTWNEHLLSAFGRSNERRVVARLAWLADVALTIHKAHRFPGGFVDPVRLATFVRRTKPGRAADDLGCPAASEEELPPVSRRWNIHYAADLARFRNRAEHLLSLRNEEARVRSVPRRR
jgi:transcriptional regulator with XRE-family HTH domain